MCTKRAYSKGEAKRALGALKRRRSGRRGMSEQKAYECPECGRWHLSHYGER